MKNFMYRRAGVTIPLRLAVPAIGIALGLVIVGSAAAQGKRAARNAHPGYSRRVYGIDRPTARDHRLVILGTQGDDRIGLRLEAGRPDVLEIDEGDDGSAEFNVHLRPVDSILVDGRGGGDAIRIDETNGAFTNRIPTTIAGGEGSDRLTGGTGAELILGGAGDDSVDGNGGNDLVDLGSGDDRFVWDPGDGSDSIEGGDGADAMVFNGAGAAEKVTLSANGDRLKFVRDLGTITMDTHSVESVDFNALGGADLVTVNDLAGTGVTGVRVDLGAALGIAGPDGTDDRGVVNGTDGNDSITVDGDAGGIKESGLAASVTIVNADALQDRLEVNTLAGRDRVDSAGLAPGAIQLSVNGVPTL